MRSTIERDEFRRETGEPLGFSLGPALVDNKILPFNQATLPKGRQEYPLN